MSKSKHTVEMANLYSTHRCSPSRAAFLTGVYPYRYGMGADALKVNHMPLGMDPKLTLFPEILRREGNYSTHMVGKWHLGHASPDQLPHNRGFDTFYGFYEAEVNYFTHMMRDGQFLRDENGPVDKQGKYLTNDLGDMAAKLLKNSSPNDKPKFLYLPFQAPHAPVSALESVKKEFM